MQALQNICKNLQSGGRFICDLWIPWDEIIANEQNTWKVGRVAERANGSKLVLIGKDGTVKMEQQAVLHMADLFARIDRMPMRRAEMRQQKN